MIPAANIDHGLLVFGRIAVAAEKSPAARLSMLLDNGSYTIADYAPELTSAIRADAADLLVSATVDRTLVRTHAEQAVAELHRAKSGMASTESLASARTGAAERTAAPHTGGPTPTAGPAPGHPMDADAAARQFHEFDTAMGTMSTPEKDWFWKYFSGRGVPVEHGAHQLNELRAAFRSPSNADLARFWTHFADRGVDPSVGAQQIRDIAATAPPRLTARGTNAGLLETWNRMYGA
jgi:hypothetical protein